MEIRTDLNTMNISGSKGAVRPKFDNAAVINTNDTVTKAQVAEGSFKKPEFKAEEAKESQQVQESKPAKANLSSPVIAGVDAIPGPSTSIVAAQLQKLAKTGVQFFSKRLIPIPFLENKKIDADKAAAILTSGDKSAIGRLRVKSDSSKPVPMSDLNDIGEISAFKGLGVMPSEEKNIADFIGYAGKIGLEFKTDDMKNIGTYGAYNLLTSGWGIAGQNPKPVQLVRDGIGVMTIKPGDNRTTAELRKEMEEGWSAVETVKGYEDGKYILKTLNKPLFDLSFIERYKGWDQLDKYSGTTQRKYKLISKYARSRDDFDEIVDILKNQKVIRDKSEFRPDHVELMMKRVFNDDASYTEKSEIIRDLQDHSPGEVSRNKLSYVVKSFKLIQSKSKNGAEFKKYAKLYSEMIDAMKYDSRVHFKDDTNGMKYPKKAFDFIADQLKGDVDDAKAFIGLLKGSSVDEAKKRFQTFQTAIRAEDMQTRIQVSHELMGTTGYEENYKTVLENLEPGENPSGSVALMRRLRAFYRGDTLNTKKRFVEIKELAAKYGGSPEECCEVLRSVYSNMTVGMKALNTIAKPVGNESFKDRADIYKERREKYTTDSYSSYLKECDESAIEDYSIITQGKVHNETLQDANNRFNTIYDNLDGKRHIEEVRDAYIMVSEGMKEGGSVLSSNIIQGAILKGRSKDEIRHYLREGLKEAAKQSKEAAKYSKNTPDTRNGKIEQDQEKVIIGGVKLDKQRYDNLLRILDTPEK